MLHRYRYYKLTFVLKLVKSRCNTIFIQFHPSFIQYPVIGNANPERMTGFLKGQGNKAGNSYVLLNRSTERI